VFGVLSLLLCATAAAADDGSTTETVVVSGSRLGAMRSDLLGSSLSVLSPDDLVVRQTQILSDVLRDVPGVEVSRTGPVGGLTQIRMRGAEGNHTLVLIDGIKASDPYEGEFDFATLIADDVAKVEVLRGQQSALYGSDAIGGVINYITASGADAPGFRARVEGGSFGTAEVTARAAGVEGGLDYAVSGAFYHTDGVPDSPSGKRNLNSDNKALAGKFSYRVTDDLLLKAVLRFSNTTAGVNEQDFTAGSPTYGAEIDGNGSYHNQALYGLVSAEYALLDGHWKHALTIQGVNAARNGYGNSGYAADQASSGDKGQREKASYVTALDFGSSQWAQTLTGAIDLEREYYRNTDPTGYADTTLRHTDTIGFVGDYNLVYNDRLALGAAFRFDKNYRFKDDTTYHFQASYKFDFGLRLHAAAGSGIKNPGMYELFAYSPGSFIGNPNLKPEKSEGWETGLEQGFFDGRALVGVTFFTNQLHDEIITSYEPPLYLETATNAAVSSPQRGIESNIALQLDESWRIDLAYTYLHDRQNGFAAVRRAPNIGSFNLAWNSPDGRFGANLTLRYNGDQYDYNYTTPVRSYVLLPSYTLVNFGGNWKINGIFQLYGRVENLTDDKYEEVYTFRSPGRAFYVGLKAGF
jgi:vitamin B12 transporter